MITAVEPQSFGKRALVLSIALHCCAFALVMALVPLSQATVGGRGMFDQALDCKVPCAEVFALRVEHRARAAVFAGVRHVAALLPTAHPAVRAPSNHFPLSHLVHLRNVERPQAQHAPTTSSNALRASTLSIAVATGTRPADGAGAEGTTANVTIATQPNREPVASHVQPNTIGANPSTGVETASDARANRGMGPGGYGQHYDSPTLRDRALYDEVVAKIGKRGSVTIAVDDEGRATQVQINAPGLDAATLDDLRRRLLGARYIPVERDGIAFDGQLRIAATP